MNTEQLQEILNQVGPRNLLLIIQMIVSMSRDELQQLMQQLAQLVQEEDQQTSEEGQAQAAQQQQGQQNMYGG